MNPLQTRLAELRRRLRRVVTFRGGCWAFTALVGSLALACLIDQFVHVRLHGDLPALIRAVFLVATLGGTAFVAYRFLLRPMWARTDDLSLALRVEQEYPILNDALASTVQFLEQAGPSPGVSATLQREAVGRALRLAQGCDFNKAVDTRGVGPAFLALVAAGALVVPLLLWNPGLAATSLARLADPFGGHRWPGDGQQTFLTVQFPHRIGYGQKFVIRGKVTGVLPDKAAIEFQGLSPSPQLFKIEKSKDFSGGVLTAPIDMTQQRRDFKFRVRAGDAVAPPEDGKWHTVELRHPPSLVPLEGKPSPQVVLTYPRYTDLESPHRLSPGTGNIQGVAGTYVQMRAATDRPITRVWVEHRPVAPLVTEASYLAPLGATNTVQALALSAGGHAVWGKTYGTIKPDSKDKEFSLNFLPWTLGTYMLVLEDAEGLARAYEFDEHIKADPVPTVAILRPSASQSVLVNAELTVQVLAEDDVYAVRSVYLEFRHKGKDGQFLDAAPRRVPIYDHESAGAAIPQIMAALSGVPLSLPGPALRLRPRRLQVATRWSLAGLVEEGDTLLVQACAHDFNDVAAFNVPGRSPVLELRVVGKPALMAQVDDAQAKVEQELVRLREAQEKAIKKVVGAEQQWRATGKLRPEDVVEVAEAEQIQKQIQERIGLKPDEGLRGELSRLQEQLRDNKVPPTAAEERLKAMKDELDRLAREHLPEIEPRLTTARRELENKDKARLPSPKTKGDLGKARAHQEEVKQSLDELVKFMKNWADVQQMRGELRNILEEQRQLQKDAEQLELNTRKRNPKDKLPPEAEAERRRLAALQNRLAERTQELLKKLERAAEERALKDPRAAEMMQKAAELGGDDPQKGNMLVPEMRDTAKMLHDPNGERKKPEINRAIAQQGESAKTLQQMLDAMAEGRDAEVERLLKKQQQQGDGLKKLADDLERLQKKVKAAKELKDPNERKKALQDLAEEQRRLQEEAEKKARELARLQAPQAGKALDQAGQKMERAAKQLDDGMDPDEDMKEAFDQIKEAQKELDQAQAQTEEELAREQLARIADRIKGLKERQDAAIAESARIHKSMLQNSKWSRALIISLGDQAESQKLLAKETASLKEKLKGALVFELIMEKTVKAMEKASAKMKERKDKAVLRQGPEALEKEELVDENKADKLTQKSQQEASRRLQRLMDAVKPEPGVAQKPKKDDKKQDEKQPEGQAKKSKGIQGDGIPPLAQLKALRGEQQEVNERTREFAQEHPNVDNLPEPERAELEGIRQDQERLFELFQKMSAAVNGQGGMQ